MDKSALLNEIVNHPNFEPMITKALVSDEMINEHLYPYSSRHHYNIVDMCDKLLTLIGDEFAKDMQHVKTYFKNVFLDADISELHELLDDVSHRYEYEFIDHLSELNGDFNDLIQSLFMQVFNKYSYDLIDMFECHLDNQFKFYCEDHELTSEHVDKWNTEIRGYCLSEFEEWIDCFNDVDCIAFAVRCLNAYFDCEHYYDDFESQVDDLIYSHFGLLYNL